MYDKKVFVDTETTGLFDPKMVSIAFIAYNGTERTGTGYYIMNPEGHIEESASKVNGFYDEDVKDKPLFSDIWPQISKYFEDALWCAHNSKFDEKVIINSLKRYNFPLPNYNTFCTCENAKRIIPKSEIKNYKLDTLCNYFNIEFKNHHTASFDTVACMRIFNKIVQLNPKDFLIKEGIKEDKHE